MICRGRKARATEITEPSASIPAAQSEPPDTTAGNTISDKLHEAFDVDAGIDAGEADPAVTPSTPHDNDHLLAGTSGLCRQWAGKYFPLCCPGSEQQRELGYPACTTAAPTNHT